MCLIAKSELKFQIFVFFKLNEIHVVDGPFNEDPKNINFFQGGPNFGEGRLEISTLSANSETKEARTIKLYTVIAHYIINITKQLKFLNSHCSTGCPMKKVSLRNFYSELLEASIYSS